MHRLTTAWSGPDAVWATSTDRYPGLVAHALASDASEFASSTGCVGGRAVRTVDGDPDLGPVD